MSLKLEELVGKRLTEEQFDEAAGKKDACYHKVKARYRVFPSAYASGAIAKCRKVGAANYGTGGKKKKKKKGKASGGVLSMKNGGAAVTQAKGRVRRIRDRFTRSREQTTSNKIYPCHFKSLHSNL